MSWESALIAAAGSLAGGIFGAKEQGRVSREVAKNAVSWRVADARRAGISPLVALGANVSQGNWQGVGSQIGQGIEGAAAAAADYVGNKRAEQMAQETHEASLAESQARVNRDNAEAAFMRSQELASMMSRTHVSNDAIEGKLPIPQGHMTPDGKVKQDPLTFRVPFISSVAEALGLDPIEITTNPENPPGSFFEDQYQELGNVMAIGSLLDDVGVDKITASYLRANPGVLVYDLVKRLRDAYARRVAKEYRDERRKPQTGRN